MLRDDKGRVQLDGLVAVVEGLLHLVDHASNHVLHLRLAGGHLQNEGIALSATLLKKKFADVILSTGERKPEDASKLSETRKTRNSVMIILAE